MTVKFLTTLEASAKVEKIIREAKKELTIITPFLKLSNLFLERFRDADNRGVKIKLVYGKKELKSQEQYNIEQLNNIDLYFCESLHAKCYFNEQQMVITSLNLYDYSIKNNREMGVSFKREENEKLFNDALIEANSIIQSAILEKKCLENGILAEDEKENLGNGFCIRCQKTISFNPEKPLCTSCYKVWVEYGDPDYPEKYCHVCEKKVKSSLRKPLCWECYNNSTYIK